MGIVNEAAVGLDRDLDHRWYWDPLAGEGEEPYESVTTVISSTESAPWLIPWSAKLAAQWVVTHLDTLAAMVEDGGPEAAVAYISKVAERRRDLASEIGVHQHNVMEALLLDRPLPAVPEHLAEAEVDGERVDHDAISDGLINFLSDHDVDPWLAECTVTNRELSVAGTLDMLARFPNMRLPGCPSDPLGLLDLKSGKHLKPSIRAQTGAYRRMPVAWLTKAGDRIEMPESHFEAVLHLRREFRGGYRLLLVAIEPDEDAWRWFLHARAVLHHRLTAKITGRPLYPPLPDGSQPSPYLTDLDIAGGFNRARNPLTKAGIETLEDLARLTPGQVLATPGVGDKTLAAIETVLAGYDLALRQDPTTDTEVA